MLIVTFAMEVQNYIITVMVEHNTIVVVIITNKTIVTNYHLNYKTAVAITLVLTMELAVIHMVILKKQQAPSMD